jgi:3-oxoacyl-(acyl-carrier-protein) synthase
MTPMRIPIAGMGAVCAAGGNAEDAFRNILESKDCLAPLSLFDARLRQVPLCAQVTDIPGFDRSDSPNKTTALALAAAAEALCPLLKRSGLRMGIVTATTVAGITRSERFYEKAMRDTGHLSQASMELQAHEPTALSGTLCEHFGADGFHTISTACSTGLHAVGMAKRLIEEDYYDICVAVGADALSMLTIRGFASLVLLDPNGCRPFDKRRAGISLGEGAGAMMLVAPKHAGRFERIYGYVSGWGASSDCYHMTAPHPEGEGARNAVIAALEEAKVAPGEIGMIATHGTGTPDNDKAEIRAMTSLFGKVPPFFSLKRTLGHTLAASGILEAVFAVKALQENIILPTCGFEQVDDAIGAVPSKKQKIETDHILKNSFGFGGNNAVVVFSRSGS